MMKLRWCVVVCVRTWRRLRTALVLVGRALDPLIDWAIRIARAYRRLCGHVRVHGAVFGAFPSIQLLALVPLRRAHAYAECIEECLI